MMLGTKFKRILAAAMTVMSFAVINPVHADAEWRQDGNGWWFAEGNSWATGWKFIDSSWYCFDDKGYMMTGWITDDENVYYLYPDGKMATGQASVDGECCFFSDKGVLEYINESSDCSGYNTNSGGNQIAQSEFAQTVCSRMHELVNNHRKANGLDELAIDSNLDNSAYLKSKHMVDNNYFSHDYNGQSWCDIAYSLSGQKIYGENILYMDINANSLTDAYANSLAEQMFDIWKNSPAHNANMLSGNFTSFGFGFEVNSNGRAYAAQHFR